MTGVFSVPILSLILLTLTLTNPNPNPDPTITNTNTVWKLRTQDTSDLNTSASALVPKWLLYKTVETDQH